MSDDTWLSLGKEYRVHVWVDGRVLGSGVSKVVKLFVQPPLKLQSFDWNDVRWVDLEDQKDAQIYWCTKTSKWGSVIIVSPVALAFPETVRL